MTGPFLENATKLLDAAVGASAAGHATGSMTVLIGEEGGIHIIADSDWPLERIAEHRGAHTAYRVRHQAGRIEVQGRQGSSVCHLETESPAARTRRLLRDCPQYVVNS